MRNEGTVVKRRATQGSTFRIASPDLRNDTVVSFRPVTACSRARLRFVFGRMLGQRWNVVPEQVQNFFGDGDRLEVRAFHADRAVMSLGGNVRLSLPANLRVKDQSRSSSLRDPGCNLDHVSFRDRLAEPAPDLHAREADLIPAHNVGPGEPQGKKKVFFRHLKPSEEISIVANPRRVAVGPVNANLRGKFFNRCLLGDADAARAADRRVWEKPPRACARGSDCFSSDSWLLAPNFFSPAPAPYLLDRVCPSGQVSSAFPAFLAPHKAIDYQPVAGRMERR